MVNWFSIHFTKHPQYFWDVGYVYTSNFPVCIKWFRHGASFYNFHYKLPFACKRIKVVQETAEQIKLWYICFPLIIHLTQFTLKTTMLTIQKLYKDKRSLIFLAFCLSVGHSLHGLRRPSFVQRSLPCSHAAGRTHLLLLSMLWPVRGRKASAQTQEG